MVLQECQHHWVCDSPTGPESKSRCKKCGAERTFGNHPTQEEAERLSFRKDEPAPPAKIDVKPVITDVPLVRVGDNDDGGEAETVDEEAKSRRRSHDHEWDIREPDANGVSLMRCRTCHVEVRADADGNVYDETGRMLSSGSQVQVRGERGVMVADKPSSGVRSRRDSREWDNRLPEVLKRLDETMSLGQVAREYGLSYAAFEGMLTHRGVDVGKYKTHRRGFVGHPQPTPVVARPVPAASPQQPDAPVPRTMPPLVTMLLGMLPVPPAKQELWLAAFVACYRLEMGASGPASRGG